MNFFFTMYADEMDALKAEIEKEESLKFLFVENDTSKYICSPDGRIVSTNLNVLDKCILNSLRNPKIVEFIDLYVQQNNESLNHVIYPTGWTPLMLACINVGTTVHEDVIDTLLCHMPSLNETDYNSNNAFLLACRYLKYVGANTIEKLISTGISPYCVDHLGMNALMISCLCENNDEVYKVAEILFRNGINANAIDNRERSAIYFYCSRMSIKFPMLNYADPVIGLFRKWGSELPRIGV